jgi:hypothetical protein
MWTAQCGRRRAGGYSSDIDWRSALTCSKSATDSRCAVASESTGSHGGLPYLSTGRRITEWSGVECALRYLHCTARCSWRKSACTSCIVHAVAPHTCMSRCLQETAIHSTHGVRKYIERPDLARSSQMARVFVESSGLNEHSADSNVVPSARRSFLCKISQNTASDGAAHIAPSE